MLGKLICGRLGKPIAVAIEPSGSPVIRKYSVIGGNLDALNKLIKNFPNRTSTALRLRRRSLQQKVFRHYPPTPDT